MGGYMAAVKTLTEGLWMRLNGSTRRRAQTGPPAHFLGESIGNYGFLDSGHSGGFWKPFKNS
jgi:hypothetical protein